MKPLRKRMLEDLRIRGRAENTQKSYLERIAQLAKHFGKSPDELGPEEIRAYQVYLLEYKRVSLSHLTQFVAAARFLYGITRYVGNLWFLNFLTCRKDFRKLARLRRTSLLTQERPYWIDP